MTQRPDCTNDNTDAPALAAEPSTQCQAGETRADGGSRGRGADFRVHGPAGPSSPAAVRSLRGGYREYASST